ncbi:hypothetical protein [uncultured Tateyamaria sp.]|uniref:hypothetical protein n=1 Tax=uncultured Tateyamaria sp. TaxID=455651 RepID=UPI0026155313|nr:hypothetical protein [uncultured Tateyamaria sp.]
MRLPLILAALTVPDPSDAGAWMRTQGEAFLSYSAVYEETGRLDGSVYFEYGFRPRLTLGAKVDIDMTDGRTGDGTAFLFARKPIGPTDRPGKLAFEIGLGSTFGDSSDALLRTGLSYGRGIKLWDKYGWVAIDGAVEWDLSGGPETSKLDTTAGLALNDRFKVMMQVFVSHTGSTTSTTLAPSVIWQPKEKTRSYQLGVEAEDGVLAVKLGVWRTF